MKGAPFPADEAARLAALDSLDILDTPPEQAFDDLTALAAHVCGTPIALVSLVDEHRQWFKSAHGLGISETPRAVSFCAHAILSPDQLLMVPDALQDERFADNPLVAGPPHVRAYAGAPLVTPEGAALGTLCVIDRVPRNLSPEQVDALRRIGRLVVSQLRVHETNRRLRAGQAELNIIASDLAVSERRYRALVEQAQGLICTHDLDGTITMINSAASELLGYPAGRIVGMNLREFIQRDHLGEFDVYLQGFQTGSHASGIMQLQGADGRLAALAYRNFKFEVSGQPPSVIAHGIEITDRVEAERLNRRFAATLDAAPEMVALAHPDGRPLYINPAGRRILGLSPDAPVPPIVIDPATAPPDAVVVGHPLGLATDTGLWEGEAALRTPAGGSRDLQQMVLMHRRRDGSPDFYATVMIDITEAKRGAEATRRIEERLRSVVNGLGEVVFETDAAGLWLFLNPAWTEITGFSIEESIGRPFFEFLLPDDVELNRQYFEPLIQRRKDYCRHEVRYRSKDGGFRWIEVHARLVLAPDGSVAGTTGTLRDVTEQRAMAAELLQAREEAVTASRLKSEFLANMSHEIRTPINGVIGLTTLLLDTTLSYEQREYAQGATSSAEALLGIINDVLDLSKIEAGRLDIEQLPFDVGRVLAQVRETVGVKARAKGLPLDVRCAPEVPAVVLGDAGRLRQVLLNLADNAVKFSQHGRILIEAVPAGPDRLRFTVADGGIGIPQHKLEAVFEKFRQGDSSTARRFGGTGLGLAICQQLVSLMGGSIDVASEVGKGSRFSFDLPLKAWTAGPAAVARSSVMQRSDVSGTPVRLPRRVLLVEDNAINQKVASRFLQKEGCLVDIADDGRAALAMTEAQVYEAIFMDCQMPGMDGYETTRRIRQRAEYAACPIIGLTAHAMVGDREKCLAAGMTDYLTKPLHHDDIHTALMRAADVIGQAATRLESTVHAVPTEFDPDMVLDAFDGEVEDIQQFVGMLIEAVPSYVRKLQAAAAAQDLPQMASIAHTVRGAVGNVGATRLSGAMRTVELTATDAGVVPDLAQVEQGADALVADLTRWRDRLRA